MQSSRKSLTKVDSNGGQTSTQKYQRHMDVVEKCARAYTENPRPRRLGKLYAFWYNGQNEPRIVIGPDFGFSLMEMAMVNGIIGMVLKGAFGSDQMSLFYVGLAILLSHNATFLSTVMVS